MTGKSWVDRRLAGALLCYRIVSRHSGAVADQLMDKPLVSVVIIFFDAERFIDEAIESVFAQTYDTWELLLVDDGSTDGSRGACSALRRAASGPGPISRARGSPQPWQQCVAQPRHSPRQGCIHRVARCR